jgi:dihydroxyacetone kinase
MLVTQSIMRALITQVADRVIAHAEELSDLDLAIGDGDHGINMRRGFQAILADCDVVAAQPLPEALRAIGTCLIMKVGGPSGPLTSLDMAGCSITVTALDDEMRRLWDAPVHTPALRWGV